MLVGLRVFSEVKSQIAQQVMALHHHAFVADALTHTDALFGVLPGLVEIARDQIRPEKADLCEKGIPRVAGLFRELLHATMGLDRIARRMSLAVPQRSRQCGL